MLLISPALLRARQVKIGDLAIERQLSKHLRQYTHNVLQCTAARQLEKEGKSVSAGETIGYIIPDTNHADRERRALPIELVGEDSGYDVKKYADLLLTAGANILSPVGCSTLDLRRTPSTYPSNAYNGLPQYIKR